MSLANGAKSLFVLYLMISSNYLGSLFGCRVQRLFENNMYVKHTLGFLTLYFFVALLGNDRNKGAPGRQLLESAGIYAAFVMSTKMNFRFWLPFIALVGGVYVLYIAQDALYGSDSIVSSREATALNEPQPPPTKMTVTLKRLLTEDRIATVQRYMVLAAILLMVGGFVVYMGEKKMEYGTQFNYMRFVFGNPSCKSEEVIKTTPLASKIAAAFSAVPTSLEK